MRPFQDDKDLVLVFSAQSQIKYMIITPKFHCHVPIYDMMADASDPNQSRGNGLSARLLPKGIGQKRS
jgi:hypothetical protein